MAHKFKHYNTNVCLLTLPKCVAGVPNLLHFPRRPATKRSLYSVFRSPRLLATAVRQFPIPIIYLGHSFVHPYLADAAVRVVRSRGSRPGTQPPPPTGKCGQHHSLTEHTSSSGPNLYCRP